MKSDIVRETGRRLAGRLKDIVSPRRIGTETRGSFPTGRDVDDVVPESYLRRLKHRPALAAIVGSDPLPRTEITRRLWAYIRERQLQDPKNRRVIKADDRLKAVFNGQEAVNMFELTKLVNQNLSEPQPAPPAPTTTEVLPPSAQPPQPTAEPAPTV